jgi:multidrug efflux pump subunit AcrA (membrane-fusion protein)
MQLVILATVLLSACAGAGSRQATPTPLPQLVSYEKAVYTVEKGSIVSEDKITGEVVPSKQDELFFRTSGFVTRVSVKRGDAIKQGDVLAEMQIDDLINQLQQARIDLEVAQANLANYSSQHQYDIEKAKADVAILQQRVELAEMDVEDSYGRNRTRATINLEIARQNLLLAEESLKMISEEVNPYMEQAVKRSELAVQRLEGLVAERQIVAPYDGVVLKSVVRPGQQVDAFYVVLTIGDPSELIIRAQFDWELSNKLNKDTEASLFLSADAEEGYPIQYLQNFVPYSTLVEEANTTSTSNSDFLYFTVPLEIADQLPVGRTVNMKVVLGRKENVLLLPPAALREYKGLNFVIVMEGDRRRRVEVNEIGLKTSERWEVVGDLEVGDQVLGP